MSTSSQDNKKPDKTPQTKAAVFYDGIRGGRITASKCKNCGRYYLPPRADCCECYSSDVLWESFNSAAGKLLTYTIITTPPLSFADEAPYTVGVVELDNGARVSGWVEGNTPNRLEVGMEVEVFPLQFEDGRLGIKIRTKS